MSQVVSLNFLPYLTWLKLFWVHVFVCLGS